jgi:hypothetical protein
MPSQNAFSSLRSIFISSTIRDLDLYRVEVQDALVKRANVGAYLSEDWSGGYDDTVQRCRDQLSQSDAYFGIFAFWYGSIPPHCTESITHQEFLWALEKWGASAHPLIAVFMPTGKAEKELRRKAEALFLKYHGHKTLEEQTAARSQHAKQLSAFHDAVLNPRGQWRSVNYFNSLPDLRERAIVTCLIWRGDVLAAARHGTAERSCTPTDAELGALGRVLQIAAAKIAVADIAVQSHVPGIALLVYGKEDDGQRELCSHLLTLKPFQRGLRARGRPAPERYDLSTFVSWCGQTLGVAPADRPVDTVEDLALHLRPALENRPVTLFVDHAERFPGGVVGFQSYFWKPLMDALRALWLEKASAHRLTVIVSEYTGRLDQWGRASRTHDCPGDPALLVRLPALTPFTDVEVLAWLEDLQVYEFAPDRRAGVMEIAMTSPSGERDGTPLRVFNRLKTLTLWPEE